MRERQSETWVKASKRSDSAPLVNSLTDVALALTVWRCVIDGHLSYRSRSKTIKPFATAWEWAAISIARPGGFVYFIAFFERRSLDAGVFSVHEKGMRNREYQPFSVPFEQS
jgi:hypothetical protein